MAKKRANGEGNIRKRKDGRWEGRYTAGYDPKTGKRIIKNVLGKTQGEVKEKLKKALEECQGLDVSKAADEYTVATWLRTWYELYAKPNVRTATANRYALIIETYTIPRIGDVKLYPRNKAKAGRGSSHHGQLYGASHVRQREKSRAGSANFLPGTL